MNPFAVAPFGQDPWWLVLVKVVLLFVILLAWTLSLIHISEPTRPY